VLLENQFTLQKMDPM